MEEKLTYSQALAELEKIVASLRDSSCDIDTLAERTSRASQLLEYCRRQLTFTEQQLAEILDKFQQQFLTVNRLI